LTRRVPSWDASLEKKIAVGGGGDVRLEAVVNAKYYEVEGCHEGGEPRSGKNGPGAQEYLLSEPLPDGGVVDFTYACFPPGGGGWYAGATGSEDRVQAESRSALFYNWLVDYLDEILYCSPAGAENGTWPKRTVVLVGHGDFMGYFLRRAVAGFGHIVELEGVTHRSGFVHYNTGMTELEYFGSGRFLVMYANRTPHLNHDPSLRTGGTLECGWSYVMPPDKFVNCDVTICRYGPNDSVGGHLMEQVVVLRTLYLIDRTLDLDEGGNDDGGVETFLALRGAQVVGCASFCVATGRACGVVVRPAAKRGGVGRRLVESIVDYVRSGSGTEDGGEEKRTAAGELGVIVRPSCANSLAFFQRLGFRKMGENVSLRPYCLHRLDISSFPSSCL